MPEGLESGLDGSRERYRMLFFDQVKQAWLLRKFAPTATHAYLTVFALWPLWP